MLDTTIKTAHDKEVKDTFLRKATFYSKVLKTESAVSEMKFDNFYVSSFIKKHDKKKYKYWQMKMVYNNLKGEVVYFTCMLGRGDTININNLSDKRKEKIHNKWIEFKDKEGIDIREIKIKMELCENILNND